MIDNIFRNIFVINYANNDDLLTTFGTQTSGEFVTTSYHTFYVRIFGSLTSVTYSILLSALISDYCKYIDDNFFVNLWPSSEVIMLVSNYLQRSWNSLALYSQYCCNHIWFYKGRIAVIPNSWKSKRLPKTDFLILVTGNIEILVLLVWQI